MTPQTPDDTAPTSENEAPQTEAPHADGAQTDAAQTDTPEMGGVLSVDTVRTMQGEADRLAADLDEARTAVRAAHRADSMAPAGQEQPPGEAAG